MFKLRQVDDDVTDSGAAACLLSFGIDKYAERNIFERELVLRIVRDPRCEGGRLDHFN